MYILNKIILFSVMLICIGNISFAQEEKLIKEHIKFNIYFWLGEVEMRYKNYEQAIPYFDSASMVFPSFHKPYFEAGICAALSGNHEGAYHYFAKMISTGCKFMIFPDGLGDFDQSSYYEKLLKDEDSLCKAGLYKFDTTFQQEILNFQEEGSFWTKQGIFDTVRFRAFIKICEQHGSFPTYLTVGTAAYRYSTSFIRNLLFGYDPESEDWKKLHVLLDKGFRSGGVESAVLCLIEDAHCLHKNIPQKYGILINSDFNYSDAIYPSLEELNQNRAKAGLHPIELEAKAYDLDLDKIFNKIKKD